MIGKKGSGKDAVGGIIEIRGIPSGEADSLTLTYKQNAKSLQVSISGTGYAIRSGNSNVTSVTSSATTNTYAIACGSGSTFTLTFQATTTNNVRLDDISIVVKTASVSEAYTVSFSTGTGNPSVDERTEASAGAGITLPSTSDLTPNCSGDGWVLYGWATAAYGSSSTTTAPTTTLAGLAGATYYPTADITLYAVYRKPEGLAGTTMWSENFTGESADAQPTGPTTSGGTKYGAATVTYACGASYTKVYADANAGGTSPELLVPKSSRSESFVVSGIPSGGETSFTLTYRTNQSGLSVTSGTTGVTVGAASGTNPYSRTITLNSSSITSFGLTFAMSTDNNARLDNISLVVDGTCYYWSAPTCCTSLASMNSSVSWSSGSATVSWDAAGGCGSWGLKYKKHADSDIAANWTSYAGSFGTATGRTSNSTAISSLTAGTEYDFKITGTSDGSVYCSGTVTETKSSTVPKITASSSMTDLGYAQAETPVAQTFTVSGTQLTGNLTVTAPTNFLVSLDGSSWSSAGGTRTITVSTPPNNLSSTTIYVKANSGLSEGDDPDGNITISGGGAASVNVAVSATITAPCTAPDHVEIDGRWDRFGGETISLTATAYDDSDEEITSGIIGYQWKKWNGSSWDNLSNGTVSGATTSGATSANLQITNCSKSHSGTYQCVVSTGAICSTASSSMQVKVFVLECYNGGTTDYNFTRVNDTKAGTLGLTLSANTDYTFKFHVDTKYFGHNGDITADVTNLVCYERYNDADASNITIKTGVEGGTFLIGMEYSTGGNNSNEGEPEISVTYPKKTLYLDAGGSSLWDKDGDQFAIYYQRNSGENSGWTDILSLYDCDDVYPGEVPLWHGVNVNFVRLKSTATNGNKANWWTSYKDNQTDDITVSASYNKYEITGWNESDHSAGTFTVPTYEITFSKNSADGGSDMSTVDDIECMGSATLVANTWTKTGYSFANWTSTVAVTANGSSVSAGGAIADEAELTDIASDIPLTAAWTANNYTVTLDKQSGSGGPESVSATYGSAMPTPTTMPTRTGYTFGGYYGSTGGSGTQYYAANGSSANNWNVASATTIYAKWTANPTSITLNTQSATTDGTTSVSATYDASTNLTSAITKPTKTGYSFGGYFTSTEGGGTQLIGTDGNWIASKDGYTDASKNWKYAESTLTLYAYWVEVKNFILATSSTTLEEDDEVIITNTDHTYALSTSQEKNYRARTSVSESSTNTITITAGSEVQIIGLEPADANHWRLKVGVDEYLYAAGSGSGNTLRTDTKKAIGDRGVWRITINASSEAKIAASSGYADSIMRYNDNSGSERFSCYNGTQKAVRMYYYRRTDPYIKTEPTSLSTFSYAVGYGPSLAQALTIKGFNLTGSLTVSCPTGYELSTTSAVSGFSTSNVTLTKDAKNKVNTTVYIRLAAGKSVDSYNQTMTISGGGITRKDISLSGSVVAVPASSTTYCLVTDEDDLFPDDEIVIMNSSSDRLLSVQASNNRTAATPKGGDNFTVLGPAVFTKDASDSIQNIVVEGCDDEWLFYVGDVDDNKTYLYSAGGNSNNYLRSAVLGTVKDNGKWKIQIDANLDDTIRSIGAATRNTMWYNKTNNIFSSYATNQTELPRIYAKPSATANVCGSPSALSGFETISGTVSTAQSFKVKGRNLSSNISIEAPTGYEVSKTSATTGFADDITLSPTDGKVEPTTVWVRLKAANDIADPIEGNISISATGATTRTIALSGKVNCIDPTLAFNDEEFTLTLTGSSVTSASSVFTSLSSGAYTASITHVEGDDDDALTFNTSTGKFTATAVGKWTVALSQAANGNYCAGDEVECTVEVVCGTPAAPTELDVSDIDYNQVTVSWDAVDGADHYDVIVSGKTSGGDESYTESYENITSTSTTITGLTGGCTYEYYVTVTNTCGDTEDSDIEEFTTIYSVAYHSATEDDYVIGVASGGSVVAHGTDDCDNKIFMGWTTSAVDALQQSDPTTNTTGVIASVTANTDLYAVFAAQNGHTTTTILDEKWNVVEWDGTNKIVGGAYSSWATNFSEEPTKSFKISSTTYQAIVFDVSSARTITSESAYSNLKAIQVTGSNRSSFAMSVTVKVSADKSEWTTVDTKSLGTASNSSPQTLVFTLDTKGNYYVRIETEAKSSGNKTGFTNIRLFQEQDYYLTDFSTTCDRASTPVSITWSNGEGTTLSEGTQPSSVAVGSDITMPALTKPDYRFDGWKVTINEATKSDVFAAGDTYTVNHPVTFTPQWTQVFSVSSPTEGLTSYKDVQVTSTSQTFTTLGMHNAVPSVTVADDTHFSMTINSHEANSDDEDYSYTFTYQPNAYGTGSGAATNTTTATITDARTGVVSSPITLRGRSLPEEFVIAVKRGDQWYALPNSILNNTRAVAPLKITVNDPSTPTAATYASSETAYKGTSRYESGTNVYGIRLTDLSGHWLQVSSSSGTNYVWVSESGSSTCQDWKLNSSDFNSYTLTIPSSGAGDKKFGINNLGNIGYFASDATGLCADVYLLPITNKYTDIPATVYEWGEHGVILNASMTNVSSATMHLDNNTPPSAVNLTAVNAASLTAGKYVRVYNKDVTIGAVANENKLLYIHWKNAGGTEIGVSQLTIPCVVASSNDMKSIAGTKGAWSSKSEVHILPGVTLEANPSSFAGVGALSVSQMVVYPGATLKVTSATFNATTLRLRNGWTRAGDKSYDVARVYIADDAALTKTYASMDYDIYDSDEGTHYYPIAVPFETPIMSTDSIDYVDSYLARFSKYGTHYGIKKYNGATRAESGAVDEAWEMLTSGDTLKPGIGYIMTGVGLPAYGGCIIRIPLNFDNEWTNDGEKGAATIDEVVKTKNSVKVTNYTGTAATGNKCHEGWNMLGVPYMSCYGMYSGDGTASILPGKMVVSDGKITWDADGLTYVSVPTHDFSEYIQKEITDDTADSPKDAQLLPGWSFFVQIGTSGTLTFLTANQRDDSDLPIYAPQRTEEERKPVIKTGIILSGNEASDKTTFLISDKYSNEYEIGADLEKMFGNGYTLATYSLNNDTRLAFNAMSTTDATQLIPIGVRIPAEGEYTFSLNERYAEADIERLDLIDYETGEVTNLMVADYTFTATRTQDDSRFALNVQQVRQTPTDISPTEPDKPDEARKILLNGTLYIVRDGLLYDATGKRVYTNK